MIKQRTFEEQTRWAYVKDTVTAILVAGILICFSRGLFSFLTGFINNSMTGGGILFYVKTFLVALINAVALALPVFIYGLLSDVKIKKVFSPEKTEDSIGRKTVVFVLGTLLICSLGILLFHGSFLLMNAMSSAGYIFHMGEYDFGTSLQEKIYYVIVTSAINAAFCEFFFRGVAMSRLAKDSYVLAVILPALIYAANHPTFPELPMCLVTGLVLGWMYLKVKNIYLLFVSHLILDLLLYGKAVFYSEDVQFNEFGNIILLIALLTAVICSVLLLFTGFKVKNENGNKHFTRKECLLGVFTSFGIYVLAIAVLIQFLQWHIKNPNIEVEGMKENKIITIEKSL